MDNKNPVLNEQEVSDEAIAKAMAGELTEEQLKLISELDKESSVRKLETPWIAKLFYLSCIGVSLYHFITSFIGTPVVLEHRSLHVSMMLALCFVMFKALRGEKASGCRARKTPSEILVSRR